MTRGGGRGGVDVKPYQSSEGTPKGLILQSQKAQGKNIRPV